MHQIRAVVHQPHSLRLAQSSAMAAGDECHSTRMASGSAGSFQDAVKLPIGVKIHLRKRKSIMPLNPLEKGRKMLAHRDGEKFPGVPVISLGVLQKNRECIEVDIPLGDPRLIEAAAEIDQNLKAHPSPLVLRASGAEFYSGLMDVRIAQLRLNLGRTLGDDLATQYIAISDVPANSLLHQEGEEFDLHSRGIMGGSSLLSPIHVFLRVLVFELSRMPDLFSPKPACQISPKVKRPLAGLFLAVVSADVFGNPRIEFLALRWTHQPLIAGAFSGDLQSFRRLLGVVMTQLQILLSPLSRIDVAGSKIPVGGFLGFDEVGHSHTIPTRSHIGNVFYVILKCSISLERDLSTQVVNLPLHHRASYLSDYQQLTPLSHMVPTKVCGVTAESEAKDAARGAAHQVLPSRQF